MPYPTAKLEQAFVKKKDTADAAGLHSRTTAQYYVNSIL